MQFYEADFEDNGDSFSLKLIIAKPGVARKPKPPPVVTPPPKAQSPPPPSPPKQKPKIDMKTLATVVSKTKPQPPPPKKEETKAEKLKKRDPFFETEEYPVSFSDCECIFRVVYSYGNYALMLETSCNVVNNKVN